LFTEGLGVDEEIAAILIEEGFTTMDEVAYVPESEMLQIEEFDESIVSELRQRAREFVLTKAIAAEEADESLPHDDLLQMEGMTQELAEKLASHKICSMEDLAEQATDDVVDLIGISQEQAGILIMKAREPWFATESE